MLFLSFSLRQWLWLLARALKKLPLKKLLLVQKKLLPTQLLALKLLPTLLLVQKLLPVTPQLLLAKLLKLARMPLLLLVTLLPRLATLPLLLAKLQKKLPSNSFLAFS
ncbi:MAG: hypothetical protein IPG54_08220 [Sphingomonadales bacterium]|nr:hypothetical protein [Sphingomonadales bacterium]MBK9004820.1 hypothetical protein [Sphingomonadales bacterium]MBK9267451.1 hypothetical protein [Sphingomonadales bacterium]MBP6435394.1 hypothetical protein [Sphingorhabdus sp.]